MVSDFQMEILNLHANEHASKHKCSVDGNTIPLVSLGKLLSFTASLRAAVAAIVVLNSISKL